MATILKYIKTKIDKSKKVTLHLPDVPAGEVEIVDETDQVTKELQDIKKMEKTHNIEHDMKKLVPEILNKSEEEITLDLEMLVRAYDPCISCSAHFLDVKFVNR